MGRLDGNAIAGPLRAFYGSEMTAAEGRCRHCGHAARIAELTVYVSGPGTVARCPSCEAVVLVVTENRERVGVDAAGFELR
jgi:hypothetical protein